MPAPHTPVPHLIVWDANEGDGLPPRPLWCIGTLSAQQEGDDETEPPIYAELHLGYKEDTDRLALCWNTHEALVAALEEASSRVTHDPYCHHNDRLPALRRCDCGLAEVNERIAAALATQPQP